VIFDGILDASDVPVKKFRYEIELTDIYTEPTLAVVDARGKELLPQTTGDGDTVDTEDFSSEYKELYVETVERFIRAYVSFSANTGNNVQSNFANISGLMLRDSDMYSRVQGIMDGMSWVNNTTVTYDSLDIDCFRQFGDEYFTCEVRYSITQKTYYETREIEGNYELLFVLSDGKWLAVKMINI
jgi:hypothetical protein